MKIRSSFVSNSSSSSFLLMYGNDADLKKFSGFNGYDTLMRDIAENKNRFESDLRIYVSNRYYDYYNNIEEMFLMRFFDMDNNFLCRNEFDNFISELEGDESDPFNEENANKETVGVELYRIGHMINVLCKEIFAKYEDVEEMPHRCAYPYALPEYSEYHKSVREIIDRCEKHVVDGIVNKILSSGKKCAILSYSDEYDMGSYMEHSFMHFIGQDPDGGVKVDCLSQH